MEKKRILHIGLDIATEKGGIETYILKIATYLDREKYDFAFLMYDEVKPCFYEELTKMGYRFYNVTSRKKNPIKNRRDLIKLFQKERFDYVHCHLNALNYITPVTAALKCGTKVIVHSRNAGVMTKLHSKILHKINYYRLPKDRIQCVAVSDLAGKWMFGENAKFTVLNNGLDTSIYQYSEKSRLEIRKELALNDREVILHTGAFRTQKNHEFLIDIFRAYLEINQQAILLLAGDGVLRPEIENKIREYEIDKSVKFLGIRNDVPKLLSAADKFLFPSFYEGFPNALLEAETAGLYCVAADTITKQVQIPGQCVYLSLSESAGTWAEVLGHKPMENRKDASNLVEDLGFGVQEEMKRLYTIYNQ